MRRNSLAGTLGKWGSNSSVAYRRIAMGKYLLAWIFGVPATVLIVIYLIFR